MRSSSVPPERASRPLRLVIADDHVLLRRGVVSMLEAQGFDVVAQAGDADELLRKVGAHRPDVAIVDIRMPPTNTDDGLRAAVEIRQAHPDVGVLVLSQYIEADYALELIGEDARASGTCSRTASPTSRSSRARSGAWRTGDPCSIRRWSGGCSGASARRRRWPS